MMNNRYIFFTRNKLPQSDRADLVQVASSANAAANLGYSAVLTYLASESSALDGNAWVRPFYPIAPDRQLAEFYSLQERLQVAALPMPWPIGRFQQKWTDVSTFVCKYYLPVHLRPVTKLVHSRDWNFVKAAVKSGIPAIYEHHHHDNKQFEPEIVNHPLFQIAVTVANSVRDGMISRGMPPEKVIKLHNGFNQQFATRQPEAASQWRQQLLGNQLVDQSGNQYRYLAVYSGGLNRFKGVDLLVKIAPTLPDVLFVFAGGDRTKVSQYEALAKNCGAANVAFLGHLTHDRLSSLLQAANVLLHPHCDGAEASFTSPLKFFDYLASGTPIAATEIATLEEFKPAGVVAGWCKPDDEAAIAATIRQVLDAYPYRVGGYTSGMNYVQQFSWENRIKTILSFVAPAHQPE